MARPVKGNVVVVPFPFSDLSMSKRRSAIPGLNPPLSEVIRFYPREIAFVSCLVPAWPAQK